MADSTRSRRATSYEVARASGVSQATVSYVLNDAPGQKISSATRERVLAAARQLGYRPSGPARTLSVGSSSIVLLALPDIPFGDAMERLISAITARLRSAGLTLLTCRAPTSADVLNVVDSVLPAGLISLVPLSEDALAALRTDDVPVSTIGQRRDGVAVTDFAHRQRHIGELQIDHLYLRGHRRIAFAGPSDERLERLATSRHSGAQARSVELGLAPPALYAIDITGASPSAAEVLDSWRRDHVTAVCAYNDDVAAEILRILRSAGLRAPEDLAVIGADDSAVARHTAPSLTTVGTDMDSLAAHVVAEILGGRRPDFDDHTTVIIREST